jgi:hypothetical protein
MITPTHYPNYCMRCESVNLFTMPPDIIWCLIIWCLDCEAIMVYSNDESGWQITTITVRDGSIIWQELDEATTPYT